MKFTEPVLRKMYIDHYVKSWFEIGVSFRTDEWLVRLDAAKLWDESRRNFERCTR